MSLTRQDISQLLLASGSLQERRIGYAAAPLKGEENPNVSLSDATVREMRELYARWGAIARRDCHGVRRSHGVSVIAKKFNVKHSTAHGILRGLTRMEAGGPILQGHEA